MTEPNREGPGTRRHVVSGKPYERLCLEAAENVQETLIERYAFFTEMERQARAEGDVVEAEGAHRYATWVIRAYAAESRP